MEPFKPVTTVEQLEAFGVPAPMNREKVPDVLEDVHREWIAATTLVFVASSSANGGCDVSPKGDPAVADPGQALYAEFGARTMSITAARAPLVEGGRLRAKPFPLAARSDRQGEQHTGLPAECLIDRDGHRDCRTLREGLGRPLVR